MTFHLKLRPWVTQLNKHGSEEGLPVFQVAAPSLALPAPAADVASPSWALFDQPSIGQGDVRCHTSHKA